MTVKAGTKGTVDRCFTREQINVRQVLGQLWDETNIPQTGEKCAMECGDYLLAFTRATLKTTFTVLANYHILR